MKVQTQGFANLLFMARDGGVVVIWVVFLGVSSIPIHPGKYLDTVMRMGLPKLCGVKNSKLQKGNWAKK